MSSERQGYGAEFEDSATVVAWDAADGIGAVETDGEGLKVWISWFLLADGLDAFELASGDRVNVKYRQVEQDGYEWAALAVRPLAA